MSFGQPPELQQQLNDLKRYKAGEYRISEVIEQAIFWEDRVRQAFKDNPKKRTNLKKVNDFLIEVREKNWR